MFPGYRFDAAARRFKCILFIFISIVSVEISASSFYNNCFQYTKQRQVFGKAVIENQYVHYRLAELQTEVELLRALTYRLTAQVKLHHKTSYRHHKIPYIYHKTPCRYTQVLFQAPYIG